MAIKKYNPTSPARRFMTVSDFAEITKKSPERSLLAKKDKHAGRNSYGRITVRKLIKISVNPVELILCCG